MHTPSEQRQMNRLRAAIEPDSNRLNVLPLNREPLYEERDSPIPEGFVPVLACIVGAALLLTMIATGVDGCRIRQEYERRQKVEQLSDVP